MFKAGYIPPGLRHNIMYKSKNLTLKQKPVYIDYSKLETKEESFEKYKVENPGKADDAWNDN